jgi:hypothetical protein
MLDRVLSWFGRGEGAARKRADEEAHMSASERRFIQEGVEGHQADEFVQGQLGGENPDRLLDEGGD